MCEIDSNLKIKFPIIELKTSSHDFLPSELVYTNFSFVNFFFYKINISYFKNQKYIDSNGNVFKPYKIDVDKKVLFGLLREFQVNFKFTDNHFNKDELYKYVVSQIDLKYKSVNEKYRIYLMDKLSQANSFEDIINTVLDSK